MSILVHQVKLNFCFINQYVNSVFGQVFHLMRNFNLTFFHHYLSEYYISIISMLEVSSHQYGTDKFTAVEDNDILVVKGIEKLVKTELQCITGMEDYSSKSLEVSCI